MKKILWKPSEEEIKKANMTKFIDFVNKNYDLTISDYFQLYNWSIENIPDFWSAIWQFVGIKASKKYDLIVDNLKKFPGAKWFIGSRLNFAENQLKFRNNHTAFIFYGENEIFSTITYSKLNNRVSQVANSLLELGIKPNDRICAYMPNLIETAIAMLATTSIGAIWSSCGAEIGPKAALDRLGQIEPKIMFAADGYFYKGKKFSSLSNVEKVAKNIKSLKKVIIIPYTESNPDISKIPNSIYFDNFMSNKKTIKFEQLPSDHPIFIMFSSGTTGKPKCMVQGSGGVLINHLKELILHTDLKKEDKIMYITSPSWMMWNWLLSSLAVGATIVLYEGNPNYPSPNRMWKLIQDEKITIFGCSATYINYLRNQGIEPGKNFDLSSLREISQTGSALSAEGFVYVYKKIKSDLHFNSISGGTDINGCFVAGSPILPVYAGELQSPALGMKIKAYNDKGQPVFDEQGELVCEAPSPSMPLYFWDDPNDLKYKNAYFGFYSNKNVWRHGDYIVYHSDTKGIIFYGRSDSVLKPSGVRIGTSEIYNIVEELDEISDSLVIGQNWKGDQRIILFVKLASNYKLTDDLKLKIKKILRKNASPRHVPALIFEVPDIPYTFSMKKVESAITNMVNGRPILNRGALNNPESLDYFEKLLPELQKE
ncbi:MAG: acetoacetate--CoA ligase [Candidatus Helarchaeota archaeon]